MNKLLAQRESDKKLCEFPLTDEGATAAVGFCGDAGSVYLLSYYVHHKGKLNEEILPRSTKVGKVKGGELVAITNND